MKHYNEYRNRRAQVFIDDAEAHGVIFAIHDDELCITLTEAACNTMRMSDFSSKLKWLGDEVTEIVMRRGKAGHLKLVKNG